jgi:hypothetical protein
VILPPLVFPGFTQAGGWMKTLKNFGGTLYCFNNSPYHQGKDKIISFDVLFLYTPLNVKRTLRPIPDRKKSEVILLSLISINDSSNATVKQRAIMNYYSLQRMTKLAQKMIPPGIIITHQLPTERKI